MSSMLEVHSAENGQSHAEPDVLEEVLRLRDELKLLKSDKSTYVKSQDVLHIYNQVIQQALRLEEQRRSHAAAPDGTNNAASKVDRVLEDCLQLLSLFFMTVGKNNEAPAVYALVSTIKRLLDHLGQAAFYTPKDLESISHSLERMRKNLQHNETNYPSYLISVLEDRISLCFESLLGLKAALRDVSPSLMPIHERLVSILRSLSAANTRSKYRACEVDDLHSQLIEIKNSMQDDKFVCDEDTSPKGQQVVKELMDKCFLWIDIVKDKKGEINVKFKETYDQLAEIRNHLERISLTQAWSLRETDLHNFLRQLDHFDESRQGGNFHDADGQAADLHTQRTLLYLIRRSYAYIYLLIVGSEPVSEALLPIYNQLQTLRRCLNEVKASGGVSSTRELYPYTMKLSSIESMRTDGQFKVGNDVPEGQESLSLLLTQCFELQDSLRIEAENRSAV